MDWSIMFDARVIVFGVGNILMGDDAAGPEVIRLLEADPDIPDDVKLIDIGTSIRAHLFDLIHAPDKPERIVIVDATTYHGEAPGQIFELNVDQMDPKKVNDFSVHMFPTMNMLKELADETSIEVKVIVVQTGHIPEKMEESMSEPVRAALPHVAARVKEWCLENAPAS